MSDFRFNCPDCGQHLACETGYAGYHIQCPGCHGEVIVPYPVRPDAPEQVQCISIQAPTLGDSPIVAANTNPSGIPANGLRFGCLNCGQRLACGKSFIGHHIECPKCNSPLVIPRTLQLAERPPSPPRESWTPNPSSLYQSPSVAVPRPSPRQSQQTLLDGIGSVIGQLVGGFLTAGGLVIVSLGLLFGGCMCGLSGHGTTGSMMVLLSGMMFYIVIPIVMIMAFLRWLIDD